MDQILNSEMRRDRRKNFLGALRLWVGRRWKALLARLHLKNLRKIELMK